MSIIDFTKMDSRDLFTVIQIPRQKSFSVSHRALEKLDFENICVKIDEKNLNIINKNIDENNNFFMEIDNSEKMNIIDYNQEIIVNDNNTKEVFSIVEKKILTMEDFKSNINCNNELILYQKCGENEGKIRLIIAEKK